MKIVDPIVELLAIKFYEHDHQGMWPVNLWPMCGYGWNRSNGERLSIWRGSPGTEGDCRICAKNVRDGKRPHFKPFPHKTRWI